MPMVAVFPSTLIHSCSLVYLKSAGYGIESQLLTRSKSLATKDTKNKGKPSGSFRLLVKRRWHNLRPDALPANFDQQFCSDAGHLNRHIGQSNIFLEKRCGRSAGHISNFPAVYIQDAVTIPCDSALDHLQAHQSASSSGSTRLVEGIAANELRLFHLAEPVRRSFPNVNRIGDFVAVEGQLRLEAQGVPSAKSTREGAELLPDIEHLIPYPGAGGFIVGNVNFEAIFAGVS